jgi:hypothetical protein
VMRVSALNCAAAARGYSNSGMEAHGQEQAQEQAQEHAGLIAGQVLAPGAAGSGQSQAGPGAGDPPGCASRRPHSHTPHPTSHTPHPAPAPALGAHTRPCLAPHTPPHQPAPTWMLAMSTGRSIVLPPTLSTAVTRSDMSPPQNAGVCTRGPAQERGWGVLGSSLGCG